MYCYKCGKELPAGAVFCPFCGTKQGAAAADPETPVQAQVPAADPVAEKLHAQFEQIIFRRVLDAYMDRDSVDAEALYRSAEAYRFDEAAVDRTVAGFQEKLEQFDQYLTKRILGGELRTLTVTEALQDEALRYGQAIGLQEEDGEEILASFLQAHEVEEKHDGLQKLLAWFAVNGQWDVAGLPDDVRPLIGEEAEQLQAAVNELETELRRLHKASGKMELSEKDMRKLQALGRKLGFETDEYVGTAIAALERKNGYIAREPDSEQQKQREEESELFAESGMHSVPTRHTALFGVPLVFPGSYFIEQDVKKRMPGFFKKIGEAAIEECAKWGSNAHTAAKMPAVIDEWADSWPERTENWVTTVAMGYGMDKDFRDAIVDELAEPVEEFVERLHGIADIFRELDGSVSQAALEGQIEKAFRSQPAVIGQGVSGMIGAAAAQSLFNAGTGLLYDVKNSWKIKKAEDRAAMLRESLFDQFKTVVRAFSRGMNEAAPMAVISVLQDAYPYAVWSLDEDKYALLSAHYDSATDDDVRRRLSAQLLRENPFAGETYDRCVAEMAKEPPEQQAADMKSLAEIADWFGVDLRKQRRRFADKMLARVAAAYPRDDMRRYEMLRQTEEVAGCRTDRGEKMLGEYVSGLIDGLQDYGAESVRAVAEKIDAFGQEYKFAVQEEQIALARKVLEKNGVCCLSEKTEDAAALQANIAEIEAVAAACPGPSFKPITGPLKARLRKLQQQAVQERQRAEKRQLASQLGKLLAVGTNHAAAVRADGTVVTMQQDSPSAVRGVNDWDNITAIAADSSITVGLNADGTAVAAGSKKPNIKDWTGIVAVAAGTHHAVGLRADGTVIAAGKDTDGQCAVSDWRDVIAIAAASCQTVGLRADGTVLAVGKNEDGQCDVGGWTDIVAISAGTRHTVGLKADGTVVAVGKNEDSLRGLCDVGGWTDIVAVAAGMYHTIGLKADGRVVAAGRTADDKDRFKDWKDIAAIAAGPFGVLGLRADGQLLCTGDGVYAGSTETVPDGRLFESLETLEQERAAAPWVAAERAAKRKAEEAAHREKQAREKANAIAKLEAQLADFEKARDQHELELSGAGGALAVNRRKKVEEALDSTYYHIREVTDKLWELQEKDPKSKESLCRKKQAEIAEYQRERSSWARELARLKGVTGMVLRKDVTDNMELADYRIETLKKELEKLQ